MDFGYFNNWNVFGFLLFVKCYENYDVFYCFVILINLNNILILLVVVCKVGVLKYVRKYLYILMKLEIYFVINKLNV